MPARLEIALQDHLLDAEGEGIRRKALDYFGIQLKRVRSVHILTIDADFSAEQLEGIRTEIFTNPVTQISSFEPLPLPFDWTIWVGYRPGVRDNPGATAVEAVEDLLGRRLAEDEAIYTSKRYCIEAHGLGVADLKKVAGELLANDIIQQSKIICAKDWDPKSGIGIIIPKVRLDHRPMVRTIPIDSDDILIKISAERNLALNPNDIPTIRAYFSGKKVQADRARVGLTDPTDVELEYISQARSDHCNHNTFRGLFHYRDLTTGLRETVNNLFKTCIEAPTLALKKKKIMG